MDNIIHYKSGYKYQLTEPYSVMTSIRPPSEIYFYYIQLTTDGLLSMIKGYAWNGANFAPDTRSIMRGSLVHDALYQLIRLWILSIDFKKEADLEFVRICREDGMCRLYSELVYQAVDKLGYLFLDEEKQRPLST